MMELAEALCLLGRSDTPLGASQQLMLFEGGGPICDWMMYDDFDQPAIVTEFCELTHDDDGEPGSATATLLTVDGQELPIGQYIDTCFPGFSEDVERSRRGRGSRRDA